MSEATAPRLHIVGGFLGSGKTTAIAAAAKRLMASGSRVGVVTNDQGRYLVDTLFFQSKDIPAVEVTGGCFCCNYDDFEEHLAALEASAHPDVIFAESVGSCADVVATVVQPLLAMGRSEARPASFTVFADCRLLRQRLIGGDLPFSQDVVYIFDKQLEEAGQIVINKSDLLPPEERDDLLQCARARFSGKQVRMQNSLDTEEVTAWLHALEGGAAHSPAVLQDIDYTRYGKGEARLAWLDRSVRLSAPAGEIDVCFIESLLTGIESAIRERNWGIGHLKFFIEAGGRGSKWSVTTMEGQARDILPPKLAAPVTLLINGRVEAGAGELERLLERTTRALCGNYDIGMETLASDHFHPAMPRPTHRVSGH